jgi:lysozyme family protein
MTQAFERAFAFTHAQENGGPDKWILSTLKDEDAQTFSGIYRKMHPEWGGWVLIDKGDTSSDQLKGMVKDFFFDRFWKRTGLEQLPFPLSGLVYDFSVNSGETTAIKKLQRLIMVKEDGIIGGNTAAMARGLPNDKLNMRYIAARLDYLNDLKGWKINSGGWSQRIADILNFAAQ